MPDVVKIGCTKRNPNVRLLEANTQNTWIYAPFKIEFAKKVVNHKEKESLLHKLLEQYAERPNRRREFFRISPEDARKFFELMDGEWWKTN